VKDPQLVSVALRHHVGLHGFDRTPAERAGLHRQLAGQFHACTGLSLQRETTASTLMADTL
jgi:hypothetical protein